MVVSPRWSHLLVIIGLVAMIVGAIDPLEGSVVILGGAACVALGASLAHSHYAHRLWWSVVLVLLGVAALWGFSAVGGIGGNTGRSNWWALTFLPLPLGWALGLVTAYKQLREMRPKVSTA
jgi:hypothetical protein